MTYYPQPSHHFTSVPSVEHQPDHRPEVAIGTSRHLGSDVALLLWRQGLFSTFDLAYVGAPGVHRVAERSKLNAETIEPTTKRAEPNATRIEPKRKRTDPKRACIQPNDGPIAPLVQPHNSLSEANSSEQAEPGAEASRVPWGDMFSVLEAKAKLGWVEGQIRAAHERIRALDPTLPELGEDGAVRRAFFRMNETLRGLHRSVCGKPSGKSQQFENIMNDRFKAMQKAILALNVQLEKVDGIPTSSQDKLKKLDETLKRKLRKISQQRAHLEVKLRARSGAKKLALESLKASTVSVGPEHPDKAGWDSMTSSEQFKRLEALGKLTTTPKQSPPAKQTTPAKLGEKRKG
jgi:hypothetical protein